MRRGFIFTVDSLVGLGLAFTALGLVMAFPLSASHSPLYRQVALERYTADLLVSMQKSGALQSALSGQDRSAASAALALSESGKCFTLGAYSSSPSRELVFAMEKSGCGGEDTEVATAVVAETYGGRLYSVVLTGWYG